VQKKDDRTSSQFIRAFFGFAKQVACITQVGDTSSRTTAVKIKNITKLCRENLADT